MTFPRSCRKSIGRQAGHEGILSPEFKKTWIRGTEKEGNLAKFAGPSHILRQKDYHIFPAPPLQKVNGKGCVGGNEPVAINSVELDWTCTSNLEKEIILVLSGSAETPPTEAFRQEIKLQTLHDLSTFSYTDPTLGTGHFC